jgi:uncharacterized protein YigE (DUF2233 family)
VRPPPEAERRRARTGLVRALPVLSFALALVAALGACKKSPRPGPPPASTAAPASSTETTAAAQDGGAAAPPGLVVETAGTITLVRVDPSRYALRLLNARSEGHARSAPAWAKDFNLLAVVNASMYEPSGLSVGLMINGASVNQSHDVAKMGGYFAFSPKRPDLAPVAAFGRDCPGFDLTRIRADYGVVFQNYRLLDCEGRPLTWKESRVFSAAAIGLDRDGWVVLAHSRAPYAMTDFARLVAAPELRMAQMFYVEGGPEASLYVEAGGARVRAIGNYEASFFRHEANDEFWELPNVVGVMAK